MDVQIQFGYFDLSSILPLHKQMAYSMLTAGLDCSTLVDHLLRPQLRIPLTQRSGHCAVAKHCPSHVTLRQTAPLSAYLPVDRPVAVTCCTSEATPSTSGEQDETSLRFLDSLKWGRDGLVAVIVQVSTLGRESGLNNDRSRAISSNRLPLAARRHWRGAYASLH